MPELATEIFHIIYLFIAPTKMNGQKDENSTRYIDSLRSWILDRVIEIFSYDI